ncbi:MAG: hypothetical protein K9G41_08210 [Flavobacteriales bacterium]|nr:hypothetical protein [Flavobacteriales bacterium]
MEVAVGIILLVGFLAVFVNFGFRLIEKRRKQVKLLRLLYPNDVEDNFMWTNGAFAHLDIDVLLWLNAPVYFRRIADDKLTDEVLNVEGEVRIASRKLILALGFFFGYFLMFWSATFFIG